MPSCESSLAETVNHDSPPSARFKCTGSPGAWTVELESNHHEPPSLLQDLHVLDDLLDKHVSHLSGKIDSLHGLLDQKLPSALDQSRVSAFREINHSRALEALHNMNRKSNGCNRGLAQHEADKIYSGEESVCGIGARSQPNGYAVFKRLTNHQSKDPYSDMIETATSTLTKHQSKDPYSDRIDSRPSTPSTSVAKVCFREHEVSTENLGEEIEQADSSNGFQDLGIAEQISRRKSRKSTAGSLSRPAAARHTTITTVSKEDEHRRQLASRVASDHSFCVETGMFVQVRLIERIAKSSLFSGTFTVLILANAVLIGGEVEWNASHVGQPAPLGFSIVGHMFTTAFVLELAIRIVAGGEHFFKEDRFWNFLDSFLVITSIAELVSDIIQQSLGVDSSKGTESTGNIRFMRIVRVTRVIRVVRVVRVIRFVRALRILVYSIVSTLKSLFWAMLLLSIIIYVFAVVFTQASTQYFQMPENNAAGNARVYWSTLPRSSFTLFKSVSGGISWQEVVDPLSDMHESYVLAFVVFITFTYFAVLNVVTGVFCQGAMENASNDYDIVVQSFVANKNTYVRKLEKLFNDLDSNRSGEITIDEFEHHFKDHKMQAYLTSLELDTGDAWTLFKLLDLDKSHVLDIEEFLLGCLRLKGPAKAIELAKMQYENTLLRKQILTFQSYAESCFETLLWDRLHPSNVDMVAL